MLAYFALPKSSLEALGERLSSPCHRGKPRLAEIKGAAGSDSERKSSYSGLAQEPPAPLSASSCCCC